MLLLLKCRFTSTETVGLLGTGAQDVHLDFHTSPGLSKLLFEEASFKTSFEGSERSAVTESEREIIPD